MTGPAPQTAVQLVKPGELEPFASIAQNGNRNERRFLEERTVPWTFYRLRGNEEHHTHGSKMARLCFLNVTLRRGRWWSFGMRLE